MAKKIEYNTLLNFSRGKYSYNDYIKVKSWFSRVGENSEMKEQLLEEWKELTDIVEGKDDSLNHIFEKIQHTILLEEKRSERKHSLWNFYRQAAAILIIPVLAFSMWYYFSSQKNQVETSMQFMAQSWVKINAPEGSRVEFLLPDSTKGWLNSGAQLKYPPVFNSHRKVELTGEAYFEVKHIDKTDFIVGVADLDVKVLGTKFNVSAYPDDPFTSVVLKEGKVEVVGKSGSFDHVISPNEKITFNHKLKTLKLAKVDASRSTAWKDGYLIIDNETLGQVTSRIERWYNIRIVIKDEQLKNYRFKATFKDEPLEEVFRLIALTTPIKYQIEKRVADTNGIMKRKRVTIKLKK